MTAKNDFRSIIVNETTHHTTDLWQECDLSSKFRRLKKHIKRFVQDEITDDSSFDSATLYVGAWMMLENYRSLALSSKNYRSQVGI